MERPLIWAEQGVGDGIPFEGLADYANGRSGAVPRAHLCISVDLIWWAHQDLNLEPTDYESAALTIEL